MSGKAIAAWVAGAIILGAVGIWLISVLAAWARNSPQLTPF